jgi:hypothetical protein
MFVIGSKHKEHVENLQISLCVWTKVETKHKEL